MSAPGQLKEQGVPEVGSRGKTSKGRPRTGGALCLVSETWPPNEMLQPTETGPLRKLGSRDQAKFLPALLLFLVREQQLWKLTQRKNRCRQNHPRLDWHNSVFSVRKANSACGRTDP